MGEAMTITPAGACYQVTDHTRPTWQRVRYVQRSTFDAFKDEAAACAWLFTPMPEAEYREAVA